MSSYQIKKKIICLNLAHTFFCGCELTLGEAQFTGDIQYTSSVTILEFFWGFFLATNL